MLVRLQILSDRGIRLANNLGGLSHRPWDICAGAIIAQEAGGFVAGSHSAPLDNDVNEDVLWGRKHIVVRAIGDTEVRASFARHEIPTPFMHSLSRGMFC